MDLQIRSSMDEYQKDTDIALSWLESSARSNGWREPTDRELSTRDLIIQATDLANAGVRLPFFAKQAFQRAIRVRQRCQQWFEVGDRSTPEQIETHRHFIEVLCECYACFDDKGLHEEGPEDKMEEVPHNLSHSFAALEIENPPSDDDRSQSSMRDDHNKDKAHVAVTGRYYKRDPLLEAAFAVYNFFQDIHSLRTDIRELWTRVAQGKMSLLAASLTASRYLLFVYELEAKVYKTFGNAYRSTGKPYQDMIGVLYNMMNPQTGHVTAYYSTPEQSEADRFAFLSIGEVLTKMVQIKPLTEIWSWPPPVPEMKLYKIPDLEFIDTDSFRDLADIDRFLTQVCMDVHLVELLESDSCADRGAMSLCLNPLQMALRGVWNGKVVTVEGVFAAGILLDFKELVGKPPKPTLPSTNQVTFLDVKKRVYRNRSFYPFEESPSQQAEDREEFESGQLPRTMYHQQMETVNLSNVIGTYAAFAETIQLVAMDGRDDFLYRADPILLGLQMVMQSLSTKSHRTGLGNLLARLGKGDMSFVDVANEVDILVARSMQAPKKTPKTPKTGNKKGKKKAKKKAKKSTQAKKVRLALSEGVIKYAEFIQTLCHELEADS